MRYKFLQIETRAGQPLQVGDATLTPVARSVRVLPFSSPRFTGGLVWNRPVAVVVETAGHKEVIPVRNVTRRRQLALLGMGLAASLLIWAVRRRR